ncbi:MAG: 2-hydroxyacid dehydrogenase [Isosphaeraceae bacterium]|jgi:phosphoglycerate dehydrogenase-like enzyme|nr:MAG: 2-hydroxyacid dehydrogenase [Isosphaeraceae bacterium]
MPLHLVVHPPLDADRLAAVQAAAPDVCFTNAATPADALAAIPTADAFLGKITPELLAHAPRLRWVQAFTASLEHYMFPALVEHPCVLTNMRGLFGDVIADQVMGYILCFARNLHIYIRNQVERAWRPVGGEAHRVHFAAGPGVASAMDRATIYLPGATLGIVGLGGIGAEVARRASAFGMTIRAVDRFPDRVAVPVGVDLDRLGGLSDLPELLATSDFIVIAAPHTPETERLFDRERLRLMKAGSYLINVGRGAIVVLDDLVAALSCGRLAGAALDVFEVEPLPPEHPLWAFENVILTPHTAGYSTAIAPRHLEVLVDNVGRFARGEPLRNPVDKRLWF